MALGSHIAERKRVRAHGGRKSVFYSNTYVNTRASHPDSFVYSVLSLIVLSTTVLILLFLMTAVYQRRHRPGGVTAAYNILHQTITFGENGELNAGSIMEEVEIVTLDFIGVAMTGW